jgi:hypothetical protein
MHSFVHDTSGKVDHGMLDAHNQCNFPPQQRAMNMPRFQFQLSYFADRWLSARVAPGARAAEEQRMPVSVCRGAILENTTNVTYNVNEPEYGSCLSAKFEISRIDFFLFS